MCKALLKENVFWSVFVIVNFVERLLEFSMTCNKFIGTVNNNKLMLSSKHQKASKKKYNSNPQTWSMNYEFVFENIKAKEKKGEKKEL